MEEDRVTFCAGAKNTQWGFFVFSFSWWRVSMLLSCLLLRGTKRNPAHNAFQLMTPLSAGHPPTPVSVAPGEICLFCFFFSTLAAARQRTCFSSCGSGPDYCPASVELRRSHRHPPGLFVFNACRFNGLSHFQETSWSWATLINCERIDTGIHSFKRGGEHRCVSPLNGVITQIIMPFFFFITPATRDQCLLMQMLGTSLFMLFAAPQN